MNPLSSFIKVDSLNRRELTFKAMAGFAGGALGCIPVELATHSHDLSHQVSTAGQWAESISMWLLYGIIGGFIVAAEGQQLELTAEAQRRFVRGFGICLLIAIFANHISNVMFNAILEAGGFNSGSGQPGSVVFLVVARIVGWTMFGTMLGVGVGVASFSPQNVLKGAVGGLVGGFFGGMMFDLIGSMSSSGLLSRLVGFCAIGLAIGLFIGLVQELTKAAWVTVAQGRLKGRQFRIEGARATIGRAEENPVGLFGDTAVQQRHAVIERRGADYVLKNLAVQDGTFVNGNRIESVDLHDNDRINIGGYEMVFHLRGTSTAARQQASLAIDPINPAHIANRLAGANANVSGPCLVDGSGQRFAVKAGATTNLGRALDNDIVVSHSSISRHHASIESRGGVFEVKDLNSQNGTFVGNRRVTTERLKDGDSVRFGEAPFTFRG